MRNFWVLTCVLVFFSCRQEVRKADLQYLNGYWVISRVESPGDETRDFGPAPAIDFIELRNLTGYSKKLQPQADGSFQTSDDAVYFKILEKDGDFLMVHKGLGEEWVERLLYLQPDAFGLVNAEDITYHYERYVPLQPAHEP